MYIYSKENKTTALKQDKFDGSIYKSFHNNTIITFNSLQNEIKPIRYMK
jgi:hypothetical protein